jgi:hypothetical protein
MSREAYQRLAKELPFQHIADGSLLSLERRYLRVLRPRWSS